MQADAGKTQSGPDDLSYLQVVIGPHGHYLVQRMKGNRKVLVSCLTSDQLLGYKAPTPILAQQTLAPRWRCIQGGLFPLLVLPRDHVLIMC